MKKRHVLHLAMGVVMTPLLGSCAADEIVGGAGSGNGVLSFGVEVNAGATEVKPMGGATRSGVRADSSATGSAVMSPDVEGFFPTSSIELSSVDGNAIYANCDERRGINMHNNVDYKTTRGSIITQDNFYGSFALYGYVYGSGSDWSSVSGSISVNEQINGIPMTKGNGSDYNASGVYWPGGSNNATFFAVAPNNCSGASITANSGGPTITYIVPQTVEDQKDLLVAVAKNVKCDGKNAPSLAFNHALAAIKFVKGDNLGGFTSISNVEISGVNNKGTLSSFTPPDTKNNLEWTIDENVTDTYSSDLSYVMFLMPQTIPDGAKLKVKFKNDTEEKDFEADLGGTTWEAGHQYTYSLSINKITGKFIFEVTSPTDPVPVEGGDAIFNVKSYFEYDDNLTKKAVKFNVESGGATSYSISGSDKDTDRKVTLTFSANTLLQAKSEVGSESSPVDLSIRTKNGEQVRETANCYVVNAPGWYMFPLVYGNGIKSSTTDYNNHLEGFKGSVFTTHENTKKMSELSSPWIYDNYSSETMSADLVWQDADKLIDYNSYQIVDVNSNKYMKFHISKSNIKQGNAVLAVKNSSNKIMWSWHIWVTALDVYSTQTVTSTYNDVTKTFNFMPVPLGWYSASETVNPKTYTLSVKQEGSGKTANETVTQAGQTGSASGTCTFYQWGRKDPFPPSDGSSTTNATDKTLYAYEIGGTSTTKNWSKSSSTANIATSILNPLTLYYNNANWCNKKSYELWNVGKDDYDVDFETITKSVYDPSPAGFRLPETAAFTGFTTKNGEWNDTTKGYTFTTNNVETYWQACGYRTWESGSLGSVGSLGSYWSAGPSSRDNGFLLYFNPSNVIPRGDDFRSFGLSVRPVSE